MNDVRKLIYGTIILFLAVVISWVSVLYVASCGLTTSCKKAAHIVERTPVPTLIPAGHVPETDMAVVEFNKCEVAATDLVGAWVAADSPESASFAFTDVNGLPCEGTFAGDIQPLFVENSLWSIGSIGCVSCHNSALTERSAGLDLTSYTAITKGKDILGGGNWESSSLFNVLVNQGLVPEGHSAEQAASGLILFAGEQVEEPATPTP
jgi:hypothetical protein